MVSDLLVSVIFASCGLRDRPTFLVNALFPWGSYLVYFELPPWVKKFENISEDEGDHVDIKAFKVSSLCVQLLSKCQVSHTGICGSPIFLVRLNRMLFV
jgi:hypothetical protein